MRLRYSGPMDLTVSGPIFHWAGPAPWTFVAVPAEPSELLRGASPWVTYGWGMIPVRARIGNTRWKTSLFPKDGRYLVPIKASVRKAERLSVGDTVTVELDVGP